MDILIFAPVLLSIAGLFYWGVQKTFLNVCLPILLVLPTYFYWKMDGFPGVDFGLAVLMPLGPALIPLLGSRWKFSRSDLWIFFYIVSSGVADLQAGEASLAKYRLFHVIVAALVPYMAGKLLIEQISARFETVKRITLILSLCCLASIPEFFLKMNLFTRAGMHIFPTQWSGWWTQVRWGFGRVAGPYGTAEVYGMILIVGVLLLLWVQRWSTSELPFTKLRSIPSKKGIQLSLGILVVTLLMTQSRGPWLGAALAFPIALVGRAKRVKRAALLLAAILLSIAIPAYIVGNRYTSGPRHDYGSEQETAQYRRELIVNYLPLAEKGGLWGWGTFHPVLNGQPSIDNEFLRVFLVQGYVGVIAYMLLIFEAGLALLRIGVATQLSKDRHFCFTLLGILFGWVVTLSTVYMGAQSYELFFLLIGWTQAIPLVHTKVPGSPKIAAAQSQVQESSLTRVYT
jgi:hypothetical protein